MNQLSVLKEYHELVAIIGIGCRLPGNAITVEHFWKNMLRGVDATNSLISNRFGDFSPSIYGKVASSFLTKTTAALIDDCYLKTMDAEFFGIPGLEAGSIDPQHRLLLEVTWEAFEDAAIPLDSLMGGPVGVFVGITTCDYQGAQIWHSNPNEINTYAATGTMSASAAGRLSYHYGFCGPSYSIDTACSSSLTALSQAVQSLRLGECDIAVCAGVNALLTPNSFLCLNELGVLSPTGQCSAFDKAANGYVRAEGCGVVVLKRRTDAISSGNLIYANIRGIAINHDGHSSSYTAPSKEAQVNVIRTALARSNISPEQICYIEAHGTGTPLGDITELQSINEVYGQSRGKTDRLLVGSVKPNIGHLEAGAGLVGVIKAALIAKKGIVPANLNFKVPSVNFLWADSPIKIPDCNTRLEWCSQQRFIGISSFGITGTNGHVILEPEIEKLLPQTDSDNSKAKDYYLKVSAKSTESLSAMLFEYSRFINQADDSLLEDICYTANYGRVSFPICYWFRVNSKAQLLQYLEISEFNTANIVAADSIGGLIVDPSVVPALAGSYCRGLPYYQFQRKEYWKDPITYHVGYASRGAANTVERHYVANKDSHSKVQENYSYISAMDIDELLAMIRREINNKDY